MLFNKNNQNIQTSLKLVAKMFLLNNSSLKLKYKYWLIVKLKTPKYYKE